MRSLRLLAPSLLIAALAAADPAPVAVVRLADGKDLLAHWDTSVFGKVWADPACERVRAMWAEQMAKAKAEVGFPPVEVIEAMNSARLAVVAKGVDATKPAGIAQIDFGALTDAIWLKATSEAKGEPATVAGADAALSHTDDDGLRAVAARFGSAVAMTFNQPDPSKPNALPKADADLMADLRLDGIVDMVRAIGVAAGQNNDASVAAMEKQLAELGITRLTYRMSIVPEGILERIETDSKTNPGMIPVDRSVLGLLPSATMMAIGFGFDGKAYWAANHGQFAASAMEAQTKLGNPVTIEHAFDAMDALLRDAGIEAGVEELVSSFKGTIVFALQPGSPFPALTFAVPRSKQIDQAIAVGAKQIEAGLPAEGQSTLVSIPNSPVPLNIGLAKDHWVFTTDPMLASDWIAGTPGGWLDSKAMTTLISKAPKDAYVLGASDTPAVIRMINGYIGMALGFAKDMPPADRQAILGAVNRLAAQASTGYLYAGSGGLGQVFEGRGIVGVMAGPVALGVGVGATAALMNKHHEPEVVFAPVADPKVAMVNLKSGIFPAEIQFQAGGYIDSDNDGIGEHGLLAELGGVSPVGNDKRLHLLDDDLANGNKDGWNYQVYLPLNDHEALGELADEKGRQANELSDLQERQWVAYAWPAEGETGTMLAITQDGMLFETPWQGGYPEWYELYGEPNWSGTPTWEKYGAAQPHDQDQAADPVQPVPAAKPTGEPLY